MTRRVFFLSLSLGVLTFALYWPAVHCGFVNFDDGLYVTENPWVQQGLTLEGATWALSTTHASNWHPVVWLSHMADCSLFGMFAGGHHLTNVVLHALDTVLLFLLLNRLTNATGRSAAVAALFAWHPLHVESVAWISERKDLLSTFFWILTLWAYVRYVEHPQWKRYAMALLLFTAGLMAKPMLVTLPFVLLVLDFWPLGRFNAPAAEINHDNAAGGLWKTSLNLLVEKWPFFVMSAASCVVTVWAQHKGGAIKSFEVVSLPMRLANALTAYGGYLAKTVWPADLAVLYPMPGHPPLFGAICSGLLLAAITLVVVRMRKRQPALLVGWLWFLGTLVPVIGLIQVGAQSMADRYTYLSLIGVFVTVVWGLADWRAAGSLPRSIKCIVASLALAGLAWVTTRQLSYWRDGTTLFEHAVRCTTGNPIAHNNLGTALSADGRTAEAMREFAEAIRLNPDYPQAHFNLAMDLGEQGKTTEAINHLQAVLRILPKEAEAHNNLGIMCAREGQLQEAVEQFTTAIALKPGYLKPHLNLAMALNKQGKTAEAIARYHVALRLEPQATEPLDKLAWIMATAGDARFRDGPGAVQLAERAAELSRHSVPAYLDTLAAAYAEAGRFKEAVATGEKALQLASAAGGKELRSQIEHRLQFYLEEKPYHEKE